MSRRSAAAITLLTALGACALATVGRAQEEVNPVRRQPAATGSDEQRVIVQLRSSAAASARAAGAADKVAALAARAGVALKPARTLGSLHVVTLDPGESTERQLERLRADPDVRFAELDRRRYPHAVPNDPLYPQQWYWQGSAATPSATSAEQAWDVTTGSAGVVIAIIDTGVRYEHPDLQRAEQGGRVLLGYDFISDSASANDGDGRDADASDPGDFLTTADAGTQRFSGCDVTASSWHGTRVAGIIGARANNAEGLAGGAWTPWLLPVRVLGKCGGFDSDILAGMLWAGGVHVDGVPDNPYPAAIENLSLGSYDDCPQSYGAVVADLAARGVTIVASAGNEGGPVGMPANCAGAVGVAGLRHAGTKVGYSNLGPEVSIAAPAGNCVNLNGPCLYSIATTINLGQQLPGASGYTDQLNFNVGTSFSAPVVAAIVGLMAGVNGNLGASQLRERLIEGARTPFPVSSDPTVPQCHVPVGPFDVQNTECSCTTDTCGGGMAYAPGAVQAALRPIAAVATPSAFTPGQNVSLDASGSAAACGRSVVSYDWSVVAPVGVGLVSPTPATAVVVAPASGSVRVRLTITDDVGRRDTTDVFVNSFSATSSAPPVAGTNACRADVALLPVTVSVAPATASLTAGGTQAFTATVTNAGERTVTWSVDGIPGGNATVGTISASGVYTAPASVPATTSVSVTAAWNGDATRSGSAQVTLTLVAPRPQSGGGGGGAGMLEMLLLAAAGAARALRRRERGGAVWHARAFAYRIHRSPA